MKICVAQTRPVKGDIQSNIVQHQKLISLAVSYGAGIIIFPELSLTGYEPLLAKELAITASDSRLTVFQESSNKGNIIIGVGAPLKGDNGITISMLIFQPNKPIQIYSKKYLHDDEQPFFINGENKNALIIDTVVAPAICYELSVPEHAENAYNNGAKIYIASVAKSFEGMRKAIDTSSAIAAKYSIPVLLANSVGYCDNFESAGKTAAWNSKGMLVNHLNDSDEGILIVDTNTGETIKQY